WRELIGEAPGDGLVAFDAAPRETHQRRVLVADETRQRVGDAEAGMETELDEIGDEARLGRGDAEIGDQREAETGADRGALDRRDDRLFRREQAHRLDIKRVHAIDAAAGDAR